MKILIAKDYEDLSKKAARLLASQIMLNPQSVLGLATGSTPEGMYKNLVEMYKNGEISFAQVTSFNLDEYIGLGSDNPNSYRYYMNQHLFKYIDIREDHIYIPCTESDDHDKVCKDYDLAIESYNGINMQVLGIGSNGHIGFNEPDVKFEAKTHVVDLNEATIEANSRFFDTKDQVPRQAISLGMKNIMQSRRIILIASGKHKAEIINKMVNGAITPDLPASVLQLHPDVTVLIDEAAASEIDI